MRPFSLPSHGTGVFVFIGDQVFGISFPEEEGLNQGPDLTVSPVLTEDVGWVAAARHVVELCNSCCYTFADAVEGKGVVSFMELGVR